MISVIISTLDCERALARTLAALVPAAVDGLVSEAIVADRGSGDDTAIVAEAAGCKFMVVDGPLGPALKAAAAAARAPFLLFLRPGIVLEASWMDEARRFVERSSPAQSAAVFRRDAMAATTLRAVCARLASALGALPRSEQGLLVARAFYDALGGHSETAGDPEAEFLRRIGRRRIVTLASAALRIDT